MIFEQLSTVFSDQIIFILLFVLRAGAIVGLLSGLFGIGGGIISVATLFYFFGFINIEEEIRMHMAVGTSLSIIIPTAITSILGHKKRKSIDFKLLKKIILGTFVGAIMGGIFASGLASSTLLLTYTVIIFLISLYMLLGRERWVISQQPPSRILTSFVGMCIGFMSAIIGIGGGALSAPFFTLYNYSIHKAVRTASAMTLIVALSGTLTYIFTGIFHGINSPFSFGYVHILALLCFMPTAIIFSPIGVYTAHKMNKFILRKAFAILLIFASINLFIEWLKVS